MSHGPRMRFSSNRADVGVAVAIEGGLFTPVIRDADQKSLSQISQEMKGSPPRPGNAGWRA